MSSDPRQNVRWHSVRSGTPGAERNAYVIGVMKCRYCAKLYKHDPAGINCISPDCLCEARAAANVSSLR